MARTSAPIPISSPSGSPTRSTSAAGGWPATRSRRWTSCARSARTSGSTSATATSRSACTARAGSRGGARLTETIEDLRRAFGVPARVLVPSDDPLRTHIQAGGRWHAFQEFMIRARAEGPIEDVEYRGARDSPRRRRSRRCARRRTIIIGPSNPVLSIDPILSVLQHELHAADAPVVAVSPLVRGAVLKGPTADCLTLGGPDAGLRRHRRPLRGPDRRARRRPARRARADAGDRRRALEPRRPAPRGARGARVRRRASVTPGCGPSRSCP